MKTRQIILIVVLIAAIGIIVSVVYKPNTYARFKDARARPDKEFQIIGDYQKTLGWKFDTLHGPHFSFHLKDELGEVSGVIYQGTKPQDFEKLEQVVVTGHWADSVFVASTLLLKCPSKYNSEKKPEEFNDQEYH